MRGRLIGQSGADERKRFPVLSFCLALSAVEGAAKNPYLFALFTKKRTDFSVASSLEMTRIK